MNTVHRTRTNVQANKRKNKTRVQQNTNTNTTNAEHTFTEHTPEHTIFLFSMAEQNVEQNNPNATRTQRGARTQRTSEQIAGGGSTGGLAGEQAGGPAGGANWLAADVCPAGGSTHRLAGGRAWRGGGSAGSARLGLAWSGSVDGRPPCPLWPLCLLWLLWLL